MTKRQSSWPSSLLFACGIASTVANAATYEELMRRPSSAWETLFFAAVLGALFVGIASVPRRLMRRREWSRPWHIAGYVPLAPLAVAMARIVIDTARDATSHNLWPFELVIWMVVAALGFLVVALVRFACVGR